MSDEPRGSAGVPVRWGLVDVFAGVIAFVLLSSVATLIARQPGVAVSPWAVFGIEQVIGGWLPLVAVVLVASRWRGRGRLRDDFGLRFEPLDLAIGILAGIVLRFAAVGTAELVRVASGTPAGAFSGGVGDPVWFVLTAVLAASLVTPFVEELFFRGLVLRSIQQAVAPDAAASAARQRAAGVAAVVGSALLFTAFHLTGVPETAAAVSRLITLFVVGLVLGALALVTGRLGPAIATHVVFNLSVAAIELVTAPAAPGLPTLG
ncbi:CPBP family intramembrane glutamic endopeptidase [Herbiconiux liangxiaofengii]|uniref:CPBP family intramembrane glutamic endopeptidase n=1 Tax=Herbiconiux liangxiaofengii TaxID=3342795 RepID=UPI0035B8332E